MPGIQMATFSLVDFSNIDSQFFIQSRSSLRLLPQIKTPPLNSQEMSCFTSLRMCAISYLMSPSLWQYHRNIEINITDNRHFTFVYLLGKLDYSLYGQRNKSWLFMSGQMQECFSLSLLLSSMILHLHHFVKITFSFSQIGTLIIGHDSRKLILTEK